MSILAGYAMRPQLAMAALLLLVVGSSLVFLQAGPSSEDQVAVTELGAPGRDGSRAAEARREPLVFAEPDDGSDEDELARRRTGTDAEEDTTTATAEAPATYSEAMAAYQAGRYAEAERLFSEIAAAGGEKAASAALHEGHAARNGSGCQRSAALYDAVASRYQGTTVGAEAAWHAATCYRAMGQLERARSHFQHLAKSPAYEKRAKTALAAVESQLQPDGSREGDSVRAAASAPTPAAAPAAKPKTAAKTKPTTKQPEAAAGAEKKESGPDSRGATTADEDQQGEAEPSNTTGTGTASESP